MNSGGDDDRQQERTIPRFVVVALGDARCPATRASLVDVSEVNGVADEPVEVGGSRSAVQVGGAGPAGSDGAWLRSAPIAGDSQPRWSAGASCIAARRTADVVSVSLFRVRRRRTRVGVGRGGRKLLWVDGDVNVAVGGRRDVAAGSLFLHAGAVPGHVPRDAAMGGRSDDGRRPRLARSASRTGTRAPVRITELR